MQNKEEIIRQLEESQCEKVKLAITDIDGILRGKVISFEKFKSVVEKGFGFCDVVFGWDACDQAYDNAQITGWHTGYPDAQAFVDLDTFRQVPWENDLPFFLADFNGELSACPRSLLKHIIKQSFDLGYSPFFSQEFEWFNFKDNSSELYGNKFSSIQPMTYGMFGYSILRASQQSEYFHALFDNLKKFNVPLEGIHTETGPGVYEAAISYAGILEAADRAVLFKSGTKEIAHRHGLIASFMAKWNEMLPGCSGHVHQSLWNEDGKKNLFYDPKKKSGRSALLENYMAGQLFCLPHILPLFAPTVNSYKRLVEGAWAPTTLTWGTDNRTTALRVLATGPGSARLETRVVGSDSNPYLAMAACLASGLYGIRKNLPLQIVETEGNGYVDKKNGILPANLWEATQAFVAHFTGTREWEWRQFSKVVTDWELKRYFEII
jgi:glutamine synthetase